MNIIRNARREVTKEKWWKIANIISRNEQSSKGFKKERVREKKMLEGKKRMKKRL